MATRFAQSDVPIPTTRAPTSSGPSMRRAKTLTRPERSVAPPPLINPPDSLLPAPSGPASHPKSASDILDTWRIFSFIVTWWAPGFILSSLGGMKDKNVQQAWREKVSLCFIISILCGLVGFATVGFSRVMCPSTALTTSQFVRKGTVLGTLGIQGHMFNATRAQGVNGTDFNALLQDPGQDITVLFQRTAAEFPACRGVSYRAAVDDPCSTVPGDTRTCSLGPMTTATFNSLGLQNTSFIVGYDWDQVASLANYLVIDGAVLNMNPYMTLHPRAIPGDDVDTAIRTMLTQLGTSGRDATRIFYNRNDLQQAVPCLVQRYYAGNIDKVTPGCFVSQLLLYAGLIVILGLVFVRFAMACFFNWFLSERLIGAVDTSSLNRSAISPAVMPEGANVSIDNKMGTAPWAGGAKKLNKPANKSNRSFASNSSTTLINPESAPVMSLAQIGAELFAVCLITCYSEGEESMRTTLDSISTTTYSDSRKLMFIVADGMITGAGEKKSTPDICVSMLEADPRFGNPQPMSYFAVGTGAKQENRAMVYAGHYTVAGRRTPTVIIVKCGTEQEAASDKKPGNRGKRDSQLILMNFFSRVTYNDRMTPLDYDLFRKIHVLMGVTPDFFEVVLMVDADTKVFPDSLKYLVNGMHHDQLIMGCCGETRIANKRQSWVTAIQVFEYFISHHLAKAFEAVFGGVTCLPGCFSMFRLKVRKSTGDDWIPLITKPEIIREYSQSEVTTLHEKNLLLLGEDRFLTTILLRTFPNRKMMFLPQARCRTIVPDTFAILLSQRRRWINSTIHNLMELVLVRNLCGTFCFSMQFVVFMDLLGTVVLPIAIALTYTLIAGMIISPPKTFNEAIPLALLVAVLGLPAVLILITTRKVVYVFWMFVYLFALPVWNFILPVYAFWHFDDFSWGETRKVEGEGKDKGHGDGHGAFDGSSVPLRRWEDWERSRLRKLKREERRRREFERNHPSGFTTGDGDLLTARYEVRSQYEGSDSASIASSDDDHWGTQIGGYNENHAQYPPPPVGLFVPEQASRSTSSLVDGAELEAMLDQGFQERPSQDSRYGSASRAPTDTPRFHLTEAQPQRGGYTPLSRSGAPGVTSPTYEHSPVSPVRPTNGASSGVGGDWQTHVKKRSGGRPADYGPLGPLDPGTRL
ncbi:glycosyltransferase family 2 protein [Jaapia argillacea MUCL 33604]|uniref:chitin synthase n=1 Tax=Jaapia argillacea MUCL 33604 TaxID=933084 RepID=A0A067PV47_9AGAM|nr:glycosyltransferase family 2 protein [Jaapia argillacea MUCL 33604]